MKYKYKTNLSQPLNLKQLFNQLKSKRISIFTYLIKSLKIIKTKVKSGLPKKYTDESKYYYPSFFIGGIIITILVFELEIKKEVLPQDFIFYALISYVLIKIVEKINFEYSGDKNLIGILKYIYILFFTYLTVIYSHEVSSYISIHLRVQPETFNQTIYYISAVKAIQFTIFMFIVPITFSLLINFIAAVIKKHNLMSVSYFIFKITVIITLMFLTQSLSISNNSTFKKPDDFWIAKHGFVDKVLCDGENYNKNEIYNSFRAHKLSNQKYLILNATGKNKKKYGYIELSCKNISYYRKFFNNTIKIIKDRVSSIRLNDIKKLVLVLQESFNITKKKFYVFYNLTN